MGERMFELLNTPETDGLVIEALGAGNLPPETLPDYKNARQRDSSRFSFSLFQWHC